MILYDDPATQLLCETAYKLPFELKDESILTEGQEVPPAEIFDGEKIIVEGN